MRTLALALVLSAAAHAASGPSAAVQASNDKLRGSLGAYLKAQGPAKDKARTEARAAVSTLLDFDAFAKSTLGERWEKLPAKDRARYTESLRGAIEANYLSRMRSTSGSDVAKVKTELLGEEPQDAGKVLVKTRYHAGEDTAQIDYLMAQEKGRWRAVDVVTEGVSLVETYRTLVSKQLAKKGFDGLLRSLDDARHREEKKDAAPAAAP